MDRIIADAGVTKDSFFYHFKSKEELPTAVLDWHQDLAFEEIGLERILAEPSPRTALFKLIRGMSSRMTVDSAACHVRGCFFGNFAPELLRWQRGSASQGQAGSDSFWGSPWLTALTSPDPYTSFEPPP